MVDKIAGVGAGAAAGVPQQGPDFSQALKAEEQFRPKKPQAGSAGRADSTLRNPSTDPAHGNGPNADLRAQAPARPGATAESARTQAPARPGATTESARTQAPARPGATAESARTQAPARPGATAESSKATTANAVERTGTAEQSAKLLTQVQQAQAKLDQILKMAESGRSFSPAELLAFQAHAYRASQELDLAGKVVEKGTAAVKQTLQTQI